MFKWLSFALLIYTSTAHALKLSESCQRQVNKAITKSCKEPEGLSVQESGFKSSVNQPETIDETTQKIKNTSGEFKIQIVYNQLIFTCAIKNPHDTFKLEAKFKIKGDESCEISTVTDLDVGTLYEKPFCDSLLSISQPKSAKIDCNTQIDAFVKEKIKDQSKIFDLENYYVLAKDEPAQKECLDYTKKIVAATDSRELGFATAMFDNEKSTLRSQRYYSVTSCGDIDKLYNQKSAEAGSSKKSTKKEPKVRAEN